MFNLQFFLFAKNAGKFTVSILCFGFRWRDAICNEVNIKMGVYNAGDAALSDNMSRNCRWYTGYKFSGIWWFDYAISFTNSRCAWGCRRQNCRKKHILLQTIQPQAIISLMCYIRVDIASLIE